MMKVYLKFNRLLVTIAIVLLLNTPRVKAQATHHDVSKSPQLIVDNGFASLYVQGKTFMIRGGELGNSTASDTVYMNQHWSTLQKLNVNTILAPVYWELLESQEGKFDFSLVDYMLRSARKSNMKLVLLWFGSWKNSMSCYAPAWIKTNTKRFPRAVNKEGKSQEILTPFNNENLQADRKAFAALMRYIKQQDAHQQTIVMVQVENEMGMLPDARDYHPEATKAFHQPVPGNLIKYLKENSSQLSGVVKSAWVANGSKTEGSWETVFGKGLATDEMFMAWYFAVYANEVTEAGKREYTIPMFVNAALNRPNVKPGDYPSGGPLPHLMDIWKVAAPSIDFLSPDFYNPDFKYWNDLYTRKDNPLFVPEIRFDETVGAKAFYAIGHYRSIGFSPFSIESVRHPNEESLTKAYGILSDIEQLMHHSPKLRIVDGVLLDKVNITQQQIQIGKYTFTFKHDCTLPWSPKAKDNEWPFAGALILQENDDTFYVAGSGVVVTFETTKTTDGITGILTIDEGNVRDGLWIPGRRMNGDQDHQGRHLRIVVDDYGIQKLKLYRY